MSLTSSKLAANINWVSLEHFAAWSSKLQPVKEVWSKPPQGFSKINFDAANREDFSSQVAVCSNFNGEIIKILTQVRPPCSFVYGEALVAQLAGVLTNSLQLDKFILEEDSTIVILSLNDPAFSIDWHIEHVMYATLSSFQVFSHWEAWKINRNVNCCVHYATYRAVARVLLDCIPSLSSPLSLSVPQWKGSTSLAPSLMRSFWFALVISYPCLCLFSLLLAASCNAFGLAVC